MKRYLQTFLITILLIFFFISSDAQTNYWGGRPGSFDVIKDVSTASVSSGATTGGVWFGDSLTSSGWFIKNYYRTTSSSGICAGQAADIRMPKVGTSPGYGVLATPFLPYGVNTVTFSEGRGTRKVSVFYTTSDTTVSTYDGLSIPSNWIFVDSTATSATKCADKVVTINSAAARRVIFTNLTTGGDMDIDSIRITSINTILPVGFLSAKSYLKDKGVKVDWSVATELNVLAYSIEKSFNGVNFSQLASVAPKNNNTTGLDYSWFDPAPSQGISYYRIKSIDKNGASILSSILKVNTSTTKTELNIAPNPVTGKQLNIQLSSLTNGNYSLRLMNDIGQEVFNTQVSTTGGSLSQSFTLPSTVKAGIYNLQLSGGEVKISKRVIVQ